MFNNLVKNLNILYLEDDALVRESITNSLEIFAKKVYSAGNGIDAINIMENHKDINLIVTDIRMPLMNGLEFVEHLRVNGYEIPVIITTAFNNLEYHKKAIELKVEKFITKPINLNSLIDSLNELGKGILEKEELEIKRIQLENYKNAITITNYVIDVDLNGEILDISDNLKYFLQDLFKKVDIFQNINQVLSTNDVERIIAKVKKFEIYNKTVVLTFKESNFTVHLTAFASILNNHEVEKITLILKDVTKIIKEKEKIIEKLYWDSLTQLPNRQALFLDLENKKYSNNPILIIDIDHYHRYVQLFGYKPCDELLVEVAKEIKNICLEDNRFKAYKIDADKYVILYIEKYKDFDEIRNFATKFINYLDDKTMTINDFDIDVSITIGACFEKTDDSYIEASIALDVAKSKKKHIIFYDDLTFEKQTFNQNILMIQKIKVAFHYDLIIPYFQAIYDENKNIVKYESLARIIDKNNNNEVLTPFYFLDLIQNSKNNVKFTKVMIRKSLENAVKIGKEISINLSYEDIIDYEILVYLEEQMKLFDVQLTIELLEKEGIKDLEKTINFCKKMKSLGVKIAIDDFGSGYSSYEYLSLIPIDIIKIDGALVKLVSEYRGYLLLESIITFAKKLDIKVIAEFVENEEIFNKLKTLGVDMFQGYYFEKPKSMKNLHFMI